MAEKLTQGQKHMLGLVARGADAEGWAPVSAPVMMIIKLVPSELVTIEAVGDEGRGRARLTATGASLLAAMEWL